MAEVPIRISVNEVQRLSRYVEELEQALLGSWEHSENDGFDLLCGVCGVEVRREFYWRAAHGEHAADCVVPALLLKRGE